MAHAHHHHHGEGHHRPGTGADGAATPLARAALLTLGFAALEAAGGWWTGSLALLSDAGHMLTDGAALMLAALAGWIARRPPSPLHSYGLGRVEVFAASINAVTMLAIVAVLVHEAWGRLQAPHEVMGGTAAAIAFAGLLLNLAIMKWLSPHRHDMNASAAALHVLGDLLGSVAAFVAGAGIALTGWTVLDPLASLVICILIAASSVRLLRHAVHALMEGTPLHLSLEEVGREIAAVEGVVSVHDLHIWTLSGTRVALSAHVVVEDIGRWSSVLERLQAMLRERYGIDHVTLQPEPVAQPMTQMSLADYRSSRGRTH